MKLILIVLDDPARRVAYNRALRNEPYRVVYAFDGEDGFDRFFETKPDLILVYEHVARLDGTLFVPLIRRQPSGGAVPVVVIGQSESLDDAEARRDAIGADVYVNARSSSEMLKQVIEPLLREGRPTRTRAPSTPFSFSERGGDTVVSHDNPFHETRPDPLAEPELVLPTTSRSAASLIEEVPREGTPSDGSDDNRPSRIRERAQGQRRSLDESRLGKRLTKRVRHIYRLLDQVDHYQLFGVERTASLAEIRKAHFDLSLEFHPDRFFLLRSGDLKEKIYAIYRRLAEAFRTLAHEERRRAYDASLEASDTSSGGVLRIEAKDPSAPVQAAAAALGVATTHDRARDLAARAQAALLEGDLHGARMYLTLARAYDPNNSSIGQALQQVVNISLPLR